jgi:hypothetical protein
MMDKAEPVVSTKDRKLLDEAAAWSLADNSQFEAMREFYQANDLFCVPAMITSYNYVIDKNLKVNLAEGG